MLARLVHQLAPFQPTLIGSFPLGLQVDGSDLDIACTCDDLDAFERALCTALSDLGIARPRIERSPLPAVVAAFELGGNAVEIFGQALPVTAQRGFRHMVIEGQLLVIGGAALATRVRALKRGGVKTEPAFAQVLGLTGEPYEALLALEAWPPERLRELVARALHPAARPAIVHHTGDRAALIPLFRLADDSDQEIASYLARGTVLVATDGSELVGHVQIIETAAPATWELKSIAVADGHRHRGLGRRLVEAGLAHARDHGASRVLLATAAADTALLRFYQRLGFRLLRIERDVFTPAAGYPAELYIDGIRLLDRAWLDFVW
ncbi:MAG TPA: GNAT family N-acetyltransferase [Kofleriaceae bacterium]|nr:GNAT family N-acetyltransferase [Kofleriaceae bacterium]